MPPHGGAGSSAREAETALLAAARRGTAEQTLVCLARVLETDGADVDARGPGDVTALHAASVRGDPTVAARLVDAGASLVARDGESGWSPLHRAFHHGSLRVAAALLEAGASLSAPLDHAGRTPVDVLSARLLSRRRRLRATRSSPTSPRPQFTSPSTRETVISNARPPPFPPCDLYCWGSGANYQLGNGARGDVVRPASIGRLALAAPPGGDPEENAGGGVVALAAAKFHSLAATADGSLFAWGHGRGGRLGVDDERTHSGDGAARDPPGFRISDRARVASSSPSARENTTPSRCATTARCSRGGETTTDDWGTPPRRRRSRPERRFIRRNRLSRRDTPSRRNTRREK